MTADPGGPGMPTATYRFQLTPEFGFAAVARQLSRLVALGVSHVYLSPIAEAVAGSSHGYDVVDHRHVRRAFGGRDGFETLLDGAAAIGLRVLIDHVPNHVAADPVDNPRWHELLALGRGSPADRWFDVDWDAGDGRVILPILGEPLDGLVASGRVAIEGDELVVPGSRLPLAPGSIVAGDVAATIDAQHYLLQHWRVPDRNVRRFFTIDGLVAVRVEHDDVAAVVDTIPATFAGHPAFAGVRLDHVDGLADPGAYVAALRDRLGGDALIYVEKIVVPGEWLPGSWSVDGTTGYEFARAVDQVMIAPGAAAPLTEMWTDLAGTAVSFHEMEAVAKAEVIDGGLAPDLDRLDRVAAAACPAVPQPARVDELRHLVGELDRYRTYLPDDPLAADVIGAISTGPVAAEILAPASPAGVELRTRWQQLTGPVMAKGAEDRSFYRSLRLASLCEVGGSPAVFGIPVTAFHDEAAERRARWPRAMLAMSTHDTKRSADVRARSAALTWRIVLDPGTIGRLRDWVGRIVGATGVHPVDAWSTVQTVVTTPGLDADRLGAYLVKACREADLRTSWTDPDDAVEGALVAAAAAALELDVAGLELDTLAAGIGLAGEALHLTAPGVPDLYQGTEAFSYRLVDPDNRVPPDWTALAAAVGLGATVVELWSARDPRCKVVLVREVLRLRHRRPASFSPDGVYVPLEAGPGSIGYRRGDDVIVVVRRGGASVTGEVALPGGTWRDVLDPSTSWSGSLDLAAGIGSGDDDTLPLVVLERS